MTVFVDTSAWYALVDRDDRSHARMVDILRAETDRVTTDHVVVESVRLLSHRIGYQVGEDFLNETIAGAMRVEIVSMADLEKAIQIGRIFADQAFSLVDRTSFAVMERLGVIRTVTLDRDFAVYRFGADQRRAFEIVR